MKHCQPVLSNCQPAWGLCQPYFCCFYLGWVVGFFTRPRLLLFLKCFDLLGLWLVLFWYCQDKRSISSFPYNIIPSNGLRYQIHQLRIHKI